MTQKSRPGQGSRNSERKAKGIMSRENATEKTSDFRRRTSIRSGGRCMRRPRVARVVASRGLELEVTIRGSGTPAASALARHCEATWRAAADGTSGTCGTNGTVGNARGTVPSEFSYIDDCVVQIRVELNLNIELENKVQKGDLYVYWPHSTSIHSGYQGVTSTEAKSHRRPPKGSVLAHELGHAEVFVTMTKPRFENDISSYLSKNSLTSEEQNEVIDLFSQAKRDALGESYKRANANTVLWFQTHDFSVTRRRNGNLKPTV